MLDLREQLERIKDDFARKSDEVLQLNAKLGAQCSRAAAGAQELQEENASLKVNQVARPDTCRGGAPGRAVAHRGRSSRTHALSVCRRR